MTKRPCLIAPGKIISAQNRIKLITLIEYHKTPEAQLVV